MRVRTKSDEPCSSKSLESSSPISPRIAKRNANLLNGFDLKNNGSFANNQLGTIPECVIKQSYECLPALKSALESKLEERWPEITYDLQFQLERMLAENIDYQKTVNGEVTFLTTGDYPTDDLSNRPMPAYDLRRSQSEEKPRGRRQKSIPFDEQPSCSKMECDEEDAGSDVVTSCGEMDEEQPYLVLDVPHRFWTWAREYIGHVDDQFIIQFNKEFYQHYHPSYLQDLLVNEPFKYKRYGTKSPKSNGVSNGNPKRFSVCNGNGAPKLTGIENGVSKKNGSGNPAVFSLMKNLVSAYTDEFKPSPKKRKHDSPLPKKRRIDFLNGCNGCSVGIENEKKEPVNENELMEMAAALTDCLGPISLMAEYESEESRDSFAISSTSKDAVSTENDGESLGKVDIEQFSYLKINEGGRNEDDKWDEVSIELLSVQSKLDKLLRKTTPVLERCKIGLEAELAHSITTKELNSADEKLFSMIENLSVGRSTFEGCLKAWNERYRPFLKHYCNAIIPADQNDQYESDWSEEFAMDSSPPRLSKH